MRFPPIFVIYLHSHSKHNNIVHSQNIDYNGVLPLFPPLSLSLAFLTIWLAFMEHSTVYLIVFSKLIMRPFVLVTYLGCFYLPMRVIMIRSLEVSVPFLPPCSLALLMIQTHPSNIGRFTSLSLTPTERALRTALRVLILDSAYHKPLEGVIISITEIQKEQPTTHTLEK